MINVPFVGVRWQYLARRNAFVGDFFYRGEHKYVQVDAGIPVLELEVAVIGYSKVFGGS